jgi:hypothetical protein
MDSNTETAPHAFDNMDEAPLTSGGSPSPLNESGRESLCALKYEKSFRAIVLLSRCGMLGAGRAQIRR